MATTTSAPLGTTKLPGTDPSVPNGYTKLSGKQSTVNPSDSITASVIIRSRWWAQLPTDKEIFTLLTSKPLRARYHLSRAEYLKTYQADPKDVEAVKYWAEKVVGLKVESDVTNYERERCCVMVSGTVAEMSKAFGTEFAMYRKPGGETGRLRTKAIFVPDDLAYVIEGVLGLSSMKLGCEKREKPAA